MKRIHRRTIKKKILNEPDNLDGVVIHPEPEVLECEVKWSLGSTAVNKASGGNGIPAELFKILKDDATKVLCSVCQQIWKTQQWPQDWKKSILIPVPKKGSTKELCGSSNHQPVALIFRASKVMLKILHVRLQHYQNRELSNIQAGFRKGKGKRDQITNICWITGKAREFQKNIYPLLH